MISNGGQSHVLNSRFGEVLSYSGVMKVGEKVYCCFIKLLEPKTKGLIDC